MVKKEKGFTIQFLPYSEIEKLGSNERMKKILGLILQDRLLILQGRLMPEEEARLIENTMMLVGNLKGFQGVELAVLSGDNEHRNLFDKVRRNIARILVGEQDAITIIGPAKMVKEIKKNPQKIELMLRKR